MKRGEVWWVNFEPSQGGEIRKVRPAVIVSNDAANKYLNRVQVIPITSKTDKVYASEALITIGGNLAKAMADQLTTASKLRFSRQIGVVSPEDLQKVESAIKVQLDLP